MKRRIMVIFLLCVLTIGVTATYLLPQKRNGGRPNRPYAACRAVGLRHGQL